MDAAEEDRETERPFLANVALLILALVATAVAAAFVLPWFTWSRPGGALLARYSPLAQGGARLNAEYDPAGAVMSWSSHNETLIPPALALASEMRKSERDAINRFFRRDGDPEGELASDELVRRMASTQVYHSRTRRLTPDGKTVDWRALAIRNDRADYLVGIYDPATDSETIFDPPVPIFEADLTAGRSWEATGKQIRTNGTTEYRYSARVIEKAAFKNAAGVFDDTLKIETHLVFTSGNETFYDSITHYWLAPGIGSVESHSLDATGAMKSRTVLASALDQHLTRAALPATTKPLEREAPARDPAKWDLSRFASTRGSTELSESSIPATWIPTTPPTLLAARHGGGLVAYNATEPGTGALWQFTPAGTIYGAPAFDPARGRIYFGAADKRLYALDSRGLFLWSFPTGDNIVTRPLVIDGAVIFGSEDRSVYWLDPDTGVEIRRKKLGGPIVSSPVLVNGRAIFGCDDGGVYAFDANNGEQKWRFAADEPVEAPIAAADGKIFAGTHGGDLHAIDAESGKAVWTTRVGDELRTAPASGGGKLYIVSGYGRLNAYDVTNGRRLWSSPEEDYVGPPVIAGDALIVGGENGDAHAVDLAGNRQRTWAAASATSPSDGVPSLTLGASEGGGAIWFADKRSVIRRLGSAADAGPVALRASWLLPFTSEPLAQSFLTIAPVGYGNQALVLDGSRNIFVLDPKTGKGRRIGAFGEKLAPSIEPTVAGDTLISMAGTTLFATELPSGAARWKFENTEAGTQPATVADETALWLTQNFPSGPDGKTQMPVGTLHALDLKTGAVRWQRALTGFMGIGRAVVSGSTIFTSAPAAAFDLATGAPLWQAAVTDSPLGGGALNDTGDTLFIGMVQTAGSRSSIAAIRTADGSVMWQSDIGESPLNPLERPWLSGDVLVVPLDSGEVIGLAVSDGKQLWRHKPTKRRYGGVSVADGRVWFTEANARVVALDAKTGRLAAHLALDIDIGNIKAFSPRPLVIGDRVVAPLAMALLGVKIPKAEREAPQP